MLAWGNLSQGLAPQLSAYLYQTQGRVWTDFYKATFYSAAGIILVFMLVNICFIKLGPQRLNTLSGLPRIICVTHVAFFTIFLGNLCALLNWTDPSFVREWGVGNLGTAYHLPLHRISPRIAAGDVCG